MKRIEALKGPAAFSMPSLPASSTPRTPLLTSVVTPVSGATPVATATPPPKATVTIIPELCKGCELCVYACPSGNLTMSPSFNGKGYHPAVFSYNGTRGPCTACGICYWVCPDFAVSEIKRLKQ
jgi:2-oxoglutarate ferredoxin oxidoreductase subunit delta